MDECRGCREYATCPILSSVLQRSFMNRTLDGIFEKMSKIEVLLRDFIENNGNPKKSPCPFFDKIRDYNRD